MPYSRAPSTRVSTSGKKTYEVTVTDMRGLDMVNPYDNIQKNRTPFAHDFRLYNEEADGRRVAISNRKGSGAYVPPVDETFDSSITATTGAADVEITASKTVVQNLTITTTGKLTNVELNLKITSGTNATLLLDFYDDASGSLGEKVASSSIPSSSLSTSYGYVGADLAEAPSFTATDVVYVAAYLQDDSTGSIYWSSTTAATGAQTSDSGISGLTSQSYVMNTKLYMSGTDDMYGIARFTPDSGTNKTLFAQGTSMYQVTNESTGAASTIATGLNANASWYDFTYADNKIFWCNGYDNLKTWDGTTVDTITHANLPVLSQVVFHKNLLFGVSAADPNKLIWSEAPGNDDGSGNYWYEAYLSTSFIYVPTSHATDPITKIIPFNDTLLIFTTTDKFVLYGDNPGNFTLRQASGSKGAVSPRGVFADENFVYSVAEDGFYRFNGSSDELLSDAVQPEFANIADKTQVAIGKYDRIVRFYYATSGSSVNNAALLWHTVFQEWMLDHDSYVKYPLTLTDGNDDYLLLEASSTCARITKAEQQYSTLGKPIDFKYYLKYEAFGAPAKKKRIVKFFPLLEGSGKDYSVTLNIDKDRTDSPTPYTIPLTVGGAKLGEFSLGDGTVLGGSSSFDPDKVRITGYFYYLQVRVERKAVNNQIKFIGHELSYRTRKL